MADFEARVASILEMMVGDTVSEMSKVVGGTMSNFPEDSACVRERTHEPVDQKVIHFSVFMTSLAQEAVEKICQLFQECSSMLQLKVAQGVAEVEDLRRRLDVAKTELRLVLENSGAHEDRAEDSRDSSHLREERLTEGLQETEQSSQPHRRVVVICDTALKRLPLFHLWQRRTSEASVRAVLVKEEGAEVLSDSTEDTARPEDGEDQDNQLVAEEPDNDDLAYNCKPKHVTKAKTDVSCKHSRKTMSKLLLKAQEHHRGSKALSCSVCGKGFSLQRSLDAHMLLHTGERPHTCDVCGKGFTLKQLLRNHQRLHGDVRPFTCEQCGRSFYRAHGLKMHQMVHTGERAYNCQFCNKSFTIPGNLQRHLRIHTGEKPFKCDTCGKSFNQADTLKGHQRIHSGERPFSCDTCGKAFIQKSALKLHQKTSHSGGSALSCVACSATAACVDLLRKHLQTHAATIPCTCVLCGEQLSSITDLRLHQQQHAVDRPHGCGLCNKTFKSSSYLKIHLKTHSGEKPFSCDICGRMFTQQSSLKTHQVVHTGEKPFTCDTCGKCFSNTGNLHRHQRIHTGEKPYSCETCGRCFNQGNSLKAHQQIHTGEKQFMCDKCGKSFSYLRNLKDHKCFYV